MKISYIKRPFGPDISSSHRHNNRKDNRAFYQTKEWRRTRNAFIQAHPYCVECGAKATVVDHIQQVILNGDKLDWNNLQSLCDPCHNARSAKQKNEMYKK